MYIYICIFVYLPVGLVINLILLDLEEVLFTDDSFQLLLAGGILLLDLLL